MAKKKYGEKTVVLRVPESRKQDVLDYIKQFEVIDLQGKGVQLFTSDSSPDKAYKRGFSEGYDKGFGDGEKCQFLMSFSMAGGEELVKKALDVWEHKVPSSLFWESAGSICSLMLESDVDTTEHQRSFLSLVKKTIP